MSFLPWYNRNLIDFLNGYLNNTMDIFEYGGGNSTLYYSSKVNSVSTIETREHWLNFIKKNQSKHNIEIKLCNNNLSNFSQQINNFNIIKFDIIVIDSIDRAKCLEYCIRFLKPKGIIILDNSERQNLINARKKIIQMNLVEKIYSGFRFDGVYSTSSIFFQDSTF